jgi:hypothetical protein
MLALPLDGFEQFLEVCADWEVGVLGGFIGSLNCDLPLVFVVVCVLPHWFLSLLCIREVLRNSSFSPASSDLDEMEDPSTSICSSAWSFSILVVFSIRKS